VASLSREAFVAAGGSKGRMEGGLSLRRRRRRRRRRGGASLKLPPEFSRKSAGNQPVARQEANPTKRSTRSTSTSERRRRKDADLEPGNTETDVDDDDEDDGEDEEGVIFRRRRRRRRKWGRWGKEATMMQSFDDSLLKQFLLPGDFF